MPKYWAYFAHNVTRAGDRQLGTALAALERRRSPHARRRGHAERQSLTCHRTQGRAGPLPEVRRTTRRRRRGHHGRAQSIGTRHARPIRFARQGGAAQRRRKLHALVATASRSSSTASARSALSCTYTASGSILGRAPPTWTRRTPRRLAPESEGRRVG